MCIGVFCNVSKHEYDLLQFTMAPLFRHPGVASIVIIHTGVDLPNSFGSLSDSFPKIREIHRNFGEGYEFRVEDGGYDQLSARTFAIEELEQDKTDWIIQFDADEFFTSAAIDAILSASDTHDIVVFDYYTLLSKTEYWFESRLLRDVGHQTLLDPHILTWRRRLEKRPQRCAQSKTMLTNTTQHCSVSFANFPYWRILALKGLYHFHLHCMLGKRNAAKRTASRSFSGGLPIELTHCIEAIHS